MKKKVTMTCVLKSGEVIKDTIKISMKDIQTVATLRELQEGIIRSVGCQKAEAANISFSGTTIATAEIAAISFKG